MISKALFRNGYGTGLQPIRHGTQEALEGYDHAWKVMFAYDGPHTAIKTVRLGPIPGEFPSDMVRQILLDKQNASEASLRSAMAMQAKPSGDKCVLCRLAFGSEYNDPGFGKQIITRNRRNRFYCNICDLFIRACPGKATLELPVLVLDVKNSRKIRNRDDVNLSKYAVILSDFHRKAAAIIQKHLGFVLNTVGDAVIAVWPSGFLPEELRVSRGWDPNCPARISAKLAISAVEDFAKNATQEFTGNSLPFRGALDTTEMAIFSVHSDEALSAFEFTDLDTSEVGIPFIDDLGNLILGEAGIPGAGGESEFQTGPAATDVAGEGVEVASELASHSSVKAGEFYVTKRTDIVAGFEANSAQYNNLRWGSQPDAGIEVRKIFHSI